MFEFLCSSTWKWDELKRAHVLYSFLSVKHTPLFLKHNITEEQSSLQWDHMAYLCTTTTKKKQLGTYPFLWGQLAWQFMSTSIKSPLCWSTVSIMGSHLPHKIPIAGLDMVGKACLVLFHHAQEHTNTKPCRLPTQHSVLVIVDR